MTASSTLTRATPRPRAGTGSFVQGSRPSRVLCSAGGQGLHRRRSAARLRRVRLAAWLPPNRMLLPGVEISSGSLGHGLPQATGTALGLRARGMTGPRVFTLVGDAELDEGSNHEATAFAGAMRLENLHHRDRQRLVYLRLARGHRGPVRIGALVGADRGRPQPRRPGEGSDRGPPRPAARRRRNEPKD